MSKRVLSSSATGESAPSAIGRNDRDRLELTSPHVGCILPFVGLFALAMFGIAIYCPTQPSCMPRNSPAWLIPVLLGMGGVMLMVMWGLWQSRQKLVFDFSRQRLLRSVHDATIKKFVTRELAFGELKHLTVSFEPARFSDDSDQWQVRLFLKNGEHFALLQTAQEEAAFKLVTRLHQMTALPVEDAREYFPLQKPTHEPGEMETREPEPPLPTDPQLRIQRMPNSMQLSFHPTRLACVNFFLTGFGAFWWFFIVMASGMMIRDVLSGKIHPEPIQYVLGPLFMLPFIAFGLVILLILAWTLFGVERLTLTGTETIVEGMLGFITVQKKVVRHGSLLRVDAPAEKTAALKLFVSEPPMLLTFGGGLQPATRQWVAWQVRRFASLPG